MQFIGLKDGKGTESNPYFTIIYSLLKEKGQVC